MTRFARAKGLNEKREEDPTPWHVMRQQLQENSNCSEQLSEIVKNATKVQETKEIWSDFGNESRKGSAPAVNKKKKLSKDILKRPSDDNNSIEMKLSPKNKKKLVEPSSKSMHVQCEESAVLNVHTTKDKNEKVISGLKTKTLKIKKNVEETTSNNIICKKDTVLDVKTIHNNREKKSVGFKNKSKYDNNSNKKQSFLSQSKHSKIPYTIIANGREIKIVKYEGFLVKKVDADHLKKLKKTLKAQNIPTDKIKAVMKLERRKAEKALAREKNNVCFHCRKFGHNFADCPDNKDSESSNSGICFKCGSLEHTHFQCKVVQNQNFRYAVCFVCKEQGHIARQCTLNPQGQYPKGGSCHLCGEVTHLRKDCPKAVEEKPSNTLTMDTFQSRQVEDLPEMEMTTKKNKKMDNKIVKF